MTIQPPRPGEIALPFDPAARAGDAHVVFIGRIRTSWTSRADAPKNPREARERGETAHIELDEPYRAGSRWTGTVLTRHRALLDASGTPRSDRAVTQAQSGAARSIRPALTTQAEPGRTGCGAPPVDRRLRRAGSRSMPLTASTAHRFSTSSRICRASTPCRTPQGDEQHLAQVHTQRRLQQDNSRRE